MEEKRRGQAASTVLVEKELAIFKVHSDSDPVAHGVALARVGCGVVVIELPRRVVRPPAQQRQQGSRSATKRSKGSGEKGGH